MINIISSSRYKINRQKIKIFVQNFFEKEQIAMEHSLNVVFVGKNKMKTLPRVGIPYAQDWKDRPMRFILDV